MKGQIKSTKAFKPYTNNKPTLKTTGAGVYIIRSSGLFSKVLYVGKSHTDLYGTLYRHFQKWTDKRHPENKKAQIFERVTYYSENRDNFLVEVIFCSNINSVDLLEMALIKKLTPRDNKQKLYFYSMEQEQEAIRKYESAGPWKAGSEETPF